MKHSRPDLANAVRELTKVMDGATTLHLDAMYRMMRYVFETRNLGLELKPNVKFTGQKLKWEMYGFSDSDYSGDRATRLSITGFIIYVLGVAVSWKSKAQRSVTLSSTEAEYVALSETSAEIMFLKQVLEFLGFEVKYPIVVHVDNMGAIYLANNQTTGVRTKHVDVRYHFVREFIEDGVVKIVYVKTDENCADMFTKNLSQKQFHYHATKYLKSVPNYTDENNKKEKAALMIEREGVESSKEGAKSDVGKVAVSNV